MTAKQVPAAEFKARCLRIIKEMNRDGETVTITNRGRPVAVEKGRWLVYPRCRRLRRRTPLRSLWNDAGHGGEVRRSLRTGDRAL